MYNLPIISIAIGHDRVGSGLCTNGPHVEILDLALLGDVDQLIDPFGLIWGSKFSCFRKIAEK